MFRVAGLKRKVNDAGYFHFQKSKMAIPRWIQMEIKSKKIKEIIAKMKFESWYFKEKCKLNYLKDYFDKLNHPSSDIPKLYFRDPGG